ncbi:MAG: hypothetical protein Q9220_005882 [cf. Caloplaca sp. 1 TL-2023]
MTAYHESRVKALSEYYALRDPDKLWIVKLGHSSCTNWQSANIDSLESVEDQVMDFRGHFVRQVQHVNLSECCDGTLDSENNAFENEWATPEISSETPVQIANIEHDSIIDLKDFIKRRDSLKSLGEDDRCLERILAIYDGNGREEMPLVATLSILTAASLEQRLKEGEAFELDDVKAALQELLTALALHDIDHGGISESTIMVDNHKRFYLRGLLRPAMMRRHRQDVQDLFKVFRPITPRYQDIKFYKYLSHPFHSVEHARDNFPTPDAEIHAISWTRDVHIC